jgi:hypothetical protein
VECSIWITERPFSGQSPPFFNLMPMTGMDRKSSVRTGYENDRFQYYQD